MSLPDLPYSEPVRLHQVAGGVKRTLEPDAAARARIARALDLASLDAFTAEMDLAPSAAGWRSVLPALQAQIQLASGFDLSREPPTVSLVGCGTEAERERDPRLVWLAGERDDRSPAQSGIERMAWGA